MKTISKPMYNIIHRELLSNDLLNKATIYSFGERLARRLPFLVGGALYGQNYLKVKEKKADCKNKFEISA